MNKKAKALTSKLKKKKRAKKLKQKKEISPIELISLRLQTTVFSRL